MLGSIRGEQDVLQKCWSVSQTSPIHHGLLDKFEHSEKLIEHQLKQKMETFVIEQAVGILFSERTAINGLNYNENIKQVRAKTAKYITINQALIKMKRLLCAYLVLGPNIQKTFSSKRSSL